MNIQLPSSIETLAHSLFTSNDVRVDIKRDDLIHPIISGNKWRKLKYLLKDAEKKECKTLVSMGGNHSNHLHALAYAGKELDFKTIGLVRGHKQQPLTATLAECLNWGMKLEYLNRVDYAQLRKKLACDAFKTKYENSYWISEGGFSDLAIQGVQEIGAEVKEAYDYIFTGVGSGSTLIGLAKAFPASKIIGITVFKGAEYLKDLLRQGFPDINNWGLDFEYHYGGFAKSNESLENLSKQFYKSHNFLLDKVYNLKVYQAILNFVAAGKIEPNSKVLMINTGGLQGSRG